MWFLLGFFCGVFSTLLFLFVALFRVRLTISPAGIALQPSQAPYTAPLIPHQYKHITRTGRLSQRIRTKRIDVSSREHVNAYISSTIAAMNADLQQEQERIDRRNARIQQQQHDGIKSKEPQRQMVHGITESCIWINVLAQRFFHSFLESIDVDDTTTMEDKINTRLSQLKLPSFIGPVSINDISFGDVFPVLHHIHVLHWTSDAPLEFEASLTYSSASAYLCLETSLQLNYPFPAFATLPIEAAISNLLIEATVRITLDPSIIDGFVSLSFVTSPTIEFTLNTEIGYQHTVNDIPYLQTALHSAIHSLIREMLVHPNRHTIPFRFLTRRSLAADESSSESEEDGMEMNGLRQRSRPPIPAINNAPVVTTSSDTSIRADRSAA